MPTEKQKAYDRARYLGNQADIKARRNARYVADKLAG
jgi:hypothetical protein